MPSESLTSEQIILLLAEAPQHIAALTAGLNSEQLQESSHPDEWSLNDVLGHLRACADVWGGCIERILAEEMPTIKAVNPRTWIKKTDYPEQEFRPSLGIYTTQRADLLALRQPLTPEQWSRKATVTGAGKPLERTVYTYAQWLAIHEKSHLKQIQQKTGQKMPTLLFPLNAIRLCMSPYLSGMVVF